MWLVFALLSSVFAALTSILATAIRTVVVLLMSWLMVFITDAQGSITEISKKKLAVSDSFRSCNGSVVAVLLQGAADRRRVQGCAD